MAHQVFLSYSTKDTAATEAVCRFLEAKGVRCWMAPRDIPVGQDWAEAIISALNRCPVMVLIFSSNANNSVQVTREVQRAFEKGLAVFPFRIEVVAPNPGLEYYLGSVHWLDALTPPLESHMGKLGVEVEKALERHIRGESPVPPDLPPVRRLPAGSGAGRKSGSGGVIAGLVAGTLLVGGGAWWLTRPPSVPPLSAPVRVEAILPESAPAVQTAMEVAPAHAIAEATPVPELLPEPAPEPTPAPTPEPSPEPTPELPPPLPTAATPLEATRELPWRDSAGTAYLPIPGSKALFAIWPTRVSDFEVFVQATQADWPKPSFDQQPDHPAVNVTWNQAQAYCQWLTERERAADRLPAGFHYRLPTEAEWHLALGLQEEAPSDPDAKLFPWGTAWPPPANAGNYAAALEVDEFSHTSPVSSFPPNPLGLHDMGGNVWQWCDQEPGPEHRAARGGSWASSTAMELSTKGRAEVVPVYRNAGYGFRCVLAPIP